MKGEIFPRMLNKGFLLILALLALGTISTAEHEGEGCYCRYGEMLKSLFDCYGEAISGLVPDISILENGKVYCPSVENVLSIIPSCQYCNSTATNKQKERCYLQQKQQASCSINQFLKKYTCESEFNKCSLSNQNKGKHTCLRDFDRCKRRIFSHDHFSGVTRFEQTTVDLQDETSTSSTEFAKYGYDRDRGKHDRKFEPCECGQSEKKTGVSMGMAVGLLFLGVVIGAIVTAVICICVPSLHGKTSVLRGKMTEHLNRSTTKEDRYQAQPHLDQSVTDNTLPVETSITYPVVPSAPANPVSSNQTGYHTLDGMSNNRDSHMYTGLQPESPEYFEPIGEDNKYQSPEHQSNKGPKAVVSPVYQEFMDNVIPSTGTNNSKHNAGNDYKKPITQNQPIRGTDTNADGTNHNYFILEAQNEANQSNLTKNERPVSDHQYFILEEQKGQQATSDYSEIPNETDKDYHNYFVLEKQQT